MKRRILFVDDDPAELQAIGQLLREPREDWELLYRRSGNDALVEMANQPCEVVFADTHMPDMSGAELLHEVRQCYPKTVRFLMGSPSDTEFISHAGGDMHQFLAKPCDEATLKSALNSSLSLDAWLTNDNIKAQVAKMRAFRSLPSLYVEVLKALQSPNASAEHIGEIVAKDLAMTTKLLQTVNSAFFALRRRVTNPTEAVVILGTETVKSLVMSIQTYAELDKLKPLYFSMDKLWRHNMAVATWAKLLTQLVTNDEKTADESFTAGMFHDIGKLVLASSMSDSYNGAQALAAKRGIPLWEVEQEIFGATHAETGAYLLGLWGLPYSILEAIALHHAPGRSGCREFSALTAVHVANVLVHEHEPDKEGLLAPQLDAAYIESLGLGERVEYWREMLFAQLSERPAHIKTRPAPPKTKPAPPKREPAAAVTPAPAPAPPSAARQHNSRPWIIAAAAGVVAFVSTGLWFSRSSHPEATPVAARKQVVKKPAEVSGVAPARKLADGPAPAEEPAPKPELPKLKLQGIYYRKSNPSAVIEGRTLYRGDRVKGGRVVAIDQQSVTLDFDGERVVLSVKR